MLKLRGFNFYHFDPLGLCELSQITRFGHKFVFLEQVFNHTWGQDGIGGNFCVLEVILECRDHFCRPPETCRGHVGITFVIILGSCWDHFININRPPESYKMFAKNHIFLHKYAFLHMLIEPYSESMHFYTGL